MRSVSTIPNERDLTVHQTYFSIISEIIVNLRFYELLNTVPVINTKM